MEGFLVVFSFLFFLLDLVSRSGLLPNERERAGIVSKFKLNSFLESYETASWFEFLSVFFRLL